jgi:hypothetical protein
MQSLLLGNESIALIFANQFIISLLDTLHFSNLTGVVGIMFAITCSFTLSIVIYFDLLGGARTHLFIALYLIFIDYFWL